MARTDTRNKSRYWQAPCLPGLSLLSAEFTTRGYAPHYHEALVVAVTDAGGSEFKSRGVVEQACPKALLVFNPAEPHSGWMGHSSMWRYRAFYLTEGALKLICKKTGADSFPYFVGNVISDHTLIDAFAGLHRALESRSDAMRADEQLTVAFSQLMKRYGAAPCRIGETFDDGPVVKAAIDYMVENHGRGVGLDDLAKMLGRTPFSLIRSFNRKVGIPPHAYLNQIRLKAACRLLKRGEKIAEVALEAGFYDQSALINHFKRAYGMTPSQYVAAVSNT